MSLVRKNGKNRKRKRRRNFTNCDIEQLFLIWPQYVADFQKQKWTADIYKQMSKDLIETGVDATPLELRMKMHNLKERYKREKLQAEQSGVASDWEYYADMSKIRQIYKNGLLETTEDFPTYDDIKMNGILKRNPNAPLPPGKMVRIVNGLHKTEPLLVPLASKQSKLSSLIQADLALPSLSSQPEPASSSFNHAPRLVKKETSYKNEILNVLQQANRIAATNIELKTKGIEHRNDILKVLMRSNELAEKEMENNAKLQGDILGLMKESNRNLQQISERILATQESIISLVKNYNSNHQFQQ